MKTMELYVKRMGANLSNFLIHFFLYFAEAVLIGRQSEQNKRHDRGHSFVAGEEENKGVGVDLTHCQPWKTKTVALQIGLSQFLMACHIYLTERCATKQLVTENGCALVLTTATQQQRLMRKPLAVASDADSDFERHCWNFESSFLQLNYSICLMLCSLCGYVATPSCIVLLNGCF